LTSATLTVAGSFEYLRRMTGLDAGLDVTEATFPSPFDYRRQAALILEHEPERTWSEHQQTARLSAYLRNLAGVTRGRTLALFTNKRQMQAVAAELHECMEDDGPLVIAQGTHGSAAAVADEFRNHPETVLLGVDALWTGQDFPGDTLVCLVIAKLPFPRQDPLFQARRRACDESGERWFESFYLPEAVLKFRQGCGRLIRTETDRGVIVVLDHRITKQRYGQAFLASLPDIEVAHARPEHLIATVAGHLARLGWLTTSEECL
jgi:ATP-dependent DNA helicase DinG